MNKKTGEKLTRRGPEVEGDTRNKDSEDYKNYMLGWRRGALSFSCDEVLSE